MKKKNADPVESGQEVERRDELGGSTVGDEALEESAPGAVQVVEAVRPRVAARSGAVARAVARRVAQMEGGRRGQRVQRTDARRQIAGRHVAALVALAALALPASTRQTWVKLGLFFQPQIKSTAPVSVMAWPGTDFIWWPRIKRTDIDQRNWRSAVSGRYRYFDRWVRQPNMKKTRANSMKLGSNPNNLVQNPVKSIKH